MHILHRILVMKIVLRFLSDSTTLIQSPQYQLKSVDFLVFRSYLACMDASMLPLASLSPWTVLLQLSMI